MSGPSQGSVREHANELIAKLAEQKKIHLDPGGDTSAIASVMPDWSKATSPIDEGGAPVVPTEAAITELPEPQAAPTPEPQARDDKGRFVGEEPTQAQEPASEPVAEAKPEAAIDAIVEQAKETASDPFADYEEVEYNDPDLDKSFKVLAKKDDANAVRRGYSRQADYTRKTMALAAARRELQPLIDNGTITNILPLVNLALNDPEYGNFVVEAARRRSLGLSLTPQQEQAVEVAQVATAATAPPQQPIAPLTDSEDPFMAQYLQPVRNELKEVLGRVNTLAAQEDQRLAQERANYNENLRRANFLQQTHEALTSYYPDEFNGDMGHDRASLERAWDYSLRSGFIGRYGENPMVVVSAWNQFRQERAAAAASPAAEAINRAAEQRVVKAAAAVVPSGTSNPNVPRKELPPIPKTRTKGLSGQEQATDVKEYAQQAMARIRAQRQQSA
jgi:hypothetical protein